MLRINEYFRPRTLDDALTLLQRDQATVPLAGGTKLVPLRAADAQAVVDLQALGLDELSVEGFHVHIGAMVPLQRLTESPSVSELLAESEHGVYKRQGSQPRGAHIYKESLPLFEDGKVTIAAQSFLRYYHPRTDVYPRGHISVWIEEQKLPADGGGA